MSFDRRGFLLGAAAVTATLSSAKAAATETINLWPGQPPGWAGPLGPELIGPNGGHRNISTPRMEVWHPEKPNGAAVLVVGGGGYTRVGVLKESEPTAAWLNAIGVTAFVLYYRLPGDGAPLIAPFQDAQRAIRIIRARAPSMGLNPSRIGVIGFSAGGHLSGVTSMRPAADLYPAIDVADRLSARPDFVGLIYPVLTLIPPFITAVSTKTLLGLNPTMELREAYSVERMVDSDAPPVFLVHADDDVIAPPENSVMMFTALRRAKIPTALHMFRNGGHGFNIGAPTTEARIWPELFANWAGFA